MIRSLEIAMREVVRELQEIRRKSRAMLMAQRLALVLSWAVGVGLILSLADYLLRFPAGFRLVLLLGGLAALGIAIVRYVMPAVRFAPSLIDMALRVERIFPALSGRLASSVEFSTGGISEHNALAARSVRDTQSRLAGASLRTVLSYGPTLRGLTAGLAVCAVLLTLTIAFPTSASTGVKRMLLPYGSAQWPARTGVESRMDEILGKSRVHPRGQVLPLRAQVTRGSEQQRVDAVYRTTVDGRHEGWERIVLTHQDGGLHERLVDSDAELIEVYFETADARTATERVLLVPPPEVERATLQIDPPAYAVEYLAPLVAELGPGLDARSATETPSLVGSMAHLTIVLNKPLPGPGESMAAWMAATFGWSDAPLPEFTAVEGQSATWELRWQLMATRTLRLALVDQHGLTNGDTISYRIDAVADLGPTATIVEPQADDVVLPGAVVDLRGESRDDVAVMELSLAAGISRVDAQEMPGARQEIGEPVWTSVSSTTSPTAALDAQLDLSSLDLQAGDTVLVQASALDGYELDGERHEASRSLIRRLRVINELEFATQLRRQLGAVRQNAIRIETMQAELQDDVIDAGMQPGVERAQAQIAERIADQRTVLEELGERLNRNRLDDQQLRDLLSQSEDLLDYAGRAANQASEAVRRAMLQQRNQPDSGRNTGDSNEQPEDSGADDSGTPSDTGDAEAGSSEESEKGAAGAGPNPADQGEDWTDLDFEVREPAAADRPAVDAQQEVRDELGDLIELLDRDEDTWVVKRQLESLLDEQRNLEAATSQLGQRTVGQSRGDMSEDDRSELDRIADAQADLAERAQQLIDELREREEVLGEVDPQSAGGMRNAADTAEQRELDREMEQAAERARQNQLQSARSNQRSARQTMEQMLNDLEENKQARAQQLLRQLASLLESIERLVTVQENELTALARAIDQNDFAGRDRSLIRLNQNTIAVAGEAREAGQSARRIARTLDRAADAQGSAVVALRAHPIDAAGAEEAENHSLELLQEAKQLAEELQEQVQEDETRRRREELVAAYRAAAERQVTLREETRQLLEFDELNRRQLVEARRHGNTQDEIRTTLHDLKTSTQELNDARVFNHVHTLIDGRSVQVSESLWDGVVDIDVIDRQTMIADSIGRLIEALEQEPGPQDEFQEQGGSGGEGQQQQQQQPLIPPASELRLLRGMQEQIYDQTVQLNDRTDLPAGSRRTRSCDLGQQQRDLMNLGQQMLDALQSQRSGPAPATGSEDGS